MWTTDWSRDGRFVVYGDIDPSRTSRSDLWVLSAADHQLKPWLGTPFRETQAQFSPDRRWIAYSSDESGRPEVYVRSFPASGHTWQVSATGGAYPKWRRDGQELFWQIGGEVPAVAVLGEVVRIGAPNRRAAGRTVPCYDRLRLPATSRWTEHDVALATRSRRIV